MTENQVIFSRLLRATIATEFMRVVVSRDAEAMKKGISVPQRPVSAFSIAEGRCEDVAPGYMDNKAEIDAKFLKIANAMNSLIGREIPMAKAWKISGYLAREWGSHVGLRPYVETARGLWKEEEQGTLQMVVAMSKKQRNHVLVTGYTTRYEHLFPEQPKELRIA